MNEGLSLSNAGANLVKAFEGCLKPIGGGRFVPYICPAGVLTIGWGHTNDHGRQFNRNSVWTQAECDAEFRSDMKRFEAAVRKYVTVPLKQYQFDALVSFTYNCGEGNLRKSTLLRKVNAGDFRGAASEFEKWTKGGGRVLAGLVRRRNSEALLFCNVPDLNYDGRPDAKISPPKNPMPQRVDPPAKPPVPKTDKSVAGATVAAATLAWWQYGLIGLAGAVFIGAAVYLVIRYFRK